MQRIASILRRARFAQADGSVLWRVWAPMPTAVSLVTFAGGRAPRDRDDARGRRLFRPSPRRGRTKDCAMRSGWPTAASIPIRRRAGNPRASIAPRPCSFPSRTPGRIAAWRGIARDDLVIYELHVGTFTPEGTFEAIIRPAAAIAGPGRDGDRVDARGPVSRRAQLGLRRRLSVCRAKQLRRAPGVAAVGRRRPSGAAWP